MTDLKAQISALNVFQLIDLQKHIAACLASRGAVPAAAEAGVKFKRGDLVEFYSTRRSCNVRVIVDRVNGKSLSCHEFDNPLQKWRIGPSLCRLVGADKSPLGPHATHVAALAAAEERVKPSSYKSTPAATGDADWMLDQPVKPAPAPVEPMPAGAGVW